MNYGLLKREDWPQLEPVFKENGGALPMIGNIAVASNGNGITAFHCLQPVLHIEPLWVHPDYRGKVEFRELLKELTGPLPKGTEFYAFAPGDLVERICKHLRLSKLPWSVWKGVA
jgi:hypothetical protein